MFSIDMSAIFLTLCFKVHTREFLNTLFESENERQKIEPAPILGSTPDVKIRIIFFFIIGLGRLSHLFVLRCRWTGPRNFFEMSKVAFFIVIHLFYNELWPFSQ